MKKSLLGAALFCAALLAGAAERPLLRAGIITDTHVTPDIRSCASLEKALRIFEENRVDLVIHCGDVASSHKEKAYQNYRETVKKVWPENKPPELFAFAGHDRVGFESYEKAWPFFKERLEVAHEPYSKHVFAGYIFLTAPQNTNWKIYEKQIADACRETPGKPVFLIDHVPALNTCYNSMLWGNGSTKRVLAKYPQIVQLSGHVHGSFKVDRNIWQGAFTAVNAGCTSEYWSGDLIGNAPEQKRADEALLMELYKDKILFRRFDLAAGKEYKPESPWCVPLPFDPATAPYTAEKRKLIPPPQFAPGADLGLAPDAVPFSAMELTIPEIVPGDGAFLYRITMQRKNAEGKWEMFAVRELFGGYDLPPEKRTVRKHRLSAGYFDAGKAYRILVEPVNFFGSSGKPLEKVFTAPEKKAYPVVWESHEPMKDCRFLAGPDWKKAHPVENGFFVVRKTWYSRLVFPDEEKLWAGPAGSRFRFTIDMRTIVPGPDYRWAFYLKNTRQAFYAHRHITVPVGDSGMRRYVVEFDKKKPFHAYHLSVSYGYSGRLQVGYVKVERLK